MSKMVKVWLREPRYAWRNDGGEIPRRLRGRCGRHGKKTVVIDNPNMKVRGGHWIVAVGPALYAFSPADMQRLYSRVPL